MNTPSAWGGGEFAVPPVRYTEEQREARARERAASLVTKGGFAVESAIVQHVLTFLELLKSPGTAKAYANAIVHFLRWCSGRGIDPLALEQLPAEAYLTTLTRYEQNGQALRLQALRSLYRKLLAWKVVAVNPFADLKIAQELKPDATPVIEVDALARVLRLIRAWFEDSKYGLVARRDYAMIRLLGRVGPRRAEVARLTWADVSLSEYPSATFVRKGRRRDKIAIPGDAADALRVLKAALERVIGRRVHPAEPVFCLIGPTGSLALGDRWLRPLAPASVQGIAERRLRAADIEGPRCSTHLFRATSATLAYRATKDPFAVRDMLGHRNLRATDLYVKRDAYRDGSPASAWDIPEEPEETRDSGSP